MKTRTIYTLALALIFIGCIAGCATGSAGRSIDPDLTKNIQKGVTTKAELIRWFGSPQSATVDIDGRENLMWIHVETKVQSMVFTSKASTQTNSLHVILDSDGTVLQSVFNQAQTDAAGRLGD